MPELHPAVPFLVAAAIVPIVGRAGRRALALAAPAAALALVVLAPDGAQAVVRIAGQELHVLAMDALGRIFAAAFAGFSLLAGIYAWHEPSRVARAAGMVVAAGGIGVVLAGDLLSLFIFWELLAVGSLGLVWAGGRPGSAAAGYRYFLVHAAGGAALLAGILAIGPSAAVDQVPLAGLAAWLVLAGLAVNAAIPPLHGWLPDAYPRASATGMVYLSAFTTKAAVCVLARVFPGEEPLVWIGVAMALYGVVFAVLENDVRRLLGYHIISQVGYMVCGVGIGTPLALDGAAAHAFSHIFYKGLLLMAAGAVLHATGRSKLTELGGLGRRMRWTLALYAIGAFSISGVPLFNGFVSKSMVLEAAVRDGRIAAEILLVVASMGTFLHTGLKLPWFTFFGDAKGPDVARPVPAPMVAAMVLAAGVCVATGVVPSLLYQALPHASAYDPFTKAHVLGALELLLGTALVFWLLRSHLGGAATVTRDADLLYRRGAFAAVTGAAALLRDSASARATAWRLARRAGSAFRDTLARPDRRSLVSVHAAGVVLVAAALFFLLLASS